MRSAAALAAIVIALAAQTTLAGYVFRSNTPVDLVLIVVVYVAIKSGPVTGLLAGTGWRYRQTWYPASKMLGVVEGVKP